MLGRLPDCIVFWLRKERWSAAGRSAQRWLTSLATSWPADATRARRESRATSESGPGVWQSYDSNSSRHSFRFSFRAGSRDAVRSRQRVRTRAERYSGTAARWPQKALRRCSWSSDRCTTPRLLRSTTTVSGESGERPTRVWGVGVVVVVGGRERWGWGVNWVLPKNETSRTKYDNWTETKKKHGWTPPPSVWLAVLQRLKWQSLKSALNLSVANSKIYSQAYLMWGKNSTCCHGTSYRRNL